jgi:hypothetical protein
MIRLNPEEVKIILNMKPKLIKFNNYEVEVNPTYGVCNFLNFYNKIKEKNIDWENIKLDYHILCLAHRPSTLRALYLKYILDYFKDKSLVSFGFNGGITPEIQKIVEPHKLPIHIDLFGEGLKTNLFQWDSNVHECPSPKIFNCLLNVTHETNEPGNGEVRITEKIFKIFAWHQLPIIIGTAGIIDEVRDLGFDMFDDILDNHNYNKSHPNVYHLKVISLLKKICTEYPTADDVQNLRRELYPRLAYNNTLLSHYVNKDISVWSKG